MNRKNSKKIFLPLILVTLFVFSSIVPFAAADSVVLSYSFGNTYGQGADNTHFYAQTFTNTGNNELSSAIFFLYKGTGATGSLLAKLYNTTAGTYLPDDVLATSIDGINLADLGTSTAGTQVTFHFADGVTLEDGKVYAVSCEPNATITSYYYHRAIGTGSTKKSIDGEWSTISTNTIWYTFMGDNGITGTPTPTPTPTTSSSSIYEWWSSPYFALLLPLIIIIACALICAKFGGAWGFFAGLNVGVILVYVVLGEAYMPLWGVVAIVIVDALLLFGKVGFEYGR